MIALPRLLTQGGGSSSRGGSSRGSSSGSSCRGSSSSRRNTMSVHMRLRLMIVMLTVVLIASHMSVDGLSTASDRGSRKLFGGYRITPKFCRASKTLPRSDPRSHGPTICMFNHECTQRQGEVVGACMDGFLFGACCQIQGNDSPLVVEHELVHQSAAAQSYETYGLNNKRKPPTTPEALAEDTATRAPVRRPPALSGPTAADSANNIVNSVGQFVYSASSSGNGGSAGNIADSGLDADSINTIDGQLGNGYDVQADQFVVHHDSVLISSSAPPAYASRPAPVATSSAPTSSAAAATTQFAADATANSEYPTRIPTGPYADGADGFTPDHYGLLSDDILNSQSSEFTHSDITHPGVDAVIVGDDNVDLAPSTITTEAPKAQPTTAKTTVKTTLKTTVKTTNKTTKTPATTVTKAPAKPVKSTHAKPSFRPKPTKAAATTTQSTTTTIKTTTPVLYDTTSSGTGIGTAIATGTGSGSGTATGTGLGTAADTATATGSASGTATGTATGLATGPEGVGKPQGTMSDNDIESIESIILMLNDTKTGPHYNSSGSSSTPLHSGHTPTVFDVLAHTKLPLSASSNDVDYSSSRPPSTSYVYSPLPTRRPIQVHSTISSSYGAVQPLDVQSSGFHSVMPSSESITEHILSITKRPVLLTAANFAATPKPQYTNRVPDEVTITGVSSVHTTYQPANSPTVTKTKPATSTTHKTTKNPTPTVTRQPQPPSTSYVTGPTTPRPSTTVHKSPPTGTPGTRKPATSKPTNKINPQRKNQTEPSTVYIFRPTLNQQPDQPQLVYEHVIQSKPIMQYGSGPGSGGPTTQQPQSIKTSAATVATSASSTTEPPHPTVLITPKPTANQVTSNTWTPQSADTTQAQLLFSDELSTPLIPVPSNSYLFNLPTNSRPASGLVSNNIYHTNGGAPGFGSTFAYRPSTTHAPLHPSHPSVHPHPAQPQPQLRPQQTVSNDFEDPGYYAATTTPPAHRPATAGPAYGGGGGHFEASTVRDEIVTANFDLNNFPPVRNPNLNITNSVGASSGGPQAGGAGGGILADDFDAGHTPDFVEDAALNDKMGLLVSKIVESLQGNFEQLADVVYDDVVVRDPPTTKRPATATAAAAAASQAATRPTTRRPPATNAAKPAATSARPTARPSVAAAVVSTLATKRPATAGKLTTVAPTKKPAPTNVKRTTRKPVTTAGLTTRKPAAVVTKVPSTRKPTAKPTRRVTVTTTLQPTPAPPQQDEVVDEDDEEDDEEDEEEEEEDEEVVAANQAEPAEESTPFAEGRIQCGIRPQVKSGRIVGGKGAAFGEFPWQVLVRESTWLGLFTKNKCGGVLISKNYVVTAAHCQPGFLASLVTVFGEFDISGELEAKRSVTKNVKRVLVHREYDAATFENDLALLELESPIHYDTHIVPICMPSDAADFTGRMATVTGWGRLKYGGGVPSVLQEVQVPVIENSVCQEMFHTAGHSKKILPSFLCAGYANGQKDSCEGDSGGPLVLQRQDGRWELAGTVSHGIKCAAPYLPGVYMRTTYYKPWLQSIAGVH